MAKLKYTDNAASLLTATVNNVDDPATLSITAGDGAKFPALAAGEWFPVVVVKTNKLFEKMRCTARSGDSLTVTRAQGGTSKLSFAIGDAVYCGPTKEFIDELLFKEDARDGKPWYCGVAGGTANAITLTATPAVTSPYVDGLELTFVALTDNTSTTVTVNVNGVGAVNLKDANGNALGVGAIKAGGNYRIQRNGTANEFRIVSGFVPSTIPGTLTIAGLLTVNGGIDIIPKNTKMLFIDTAAPPGWAFDNTYADRVLRCASTAGGGGGTGGSWTISGLTMPHTHPVNITSGVASAGTVICVGGGGNAVTPDHTHNVVGNTSAASTSSVTHTPGWRPSYVDSIVCSMTRGP